MKEKRLKTILLPVVAVIWGLTIYRYFFDSSGGQADQNLMSAARRVEVTLTTDGAERDTFSLLKGYRDPFLSHAVRRPARTNPSPGGRGNPNSFKKAAPSRPGKRIPEKVPAKVNWAQFQYLGLISQSAGEKQIALLNHGGQLHSVEVGGHYRQIDVLKIAPDSIWIRYQGEENSISR